MPPKRILLALGLIVIAVGAAIGIYFVFFRAPAVPPVGPAAPEGTSPITGLPTAAPGAIPTVPGGVPGTLPLAPRIAQGGPTETTELTEHVVRGAELSGDGQSVAFYDESDSRFYRVSPDGVITKLSDKRFFGVENVTWASEAARAILEYPDGANVMFDFTTGEQVTLPKHWEDFDFSPSGDQIIGKSIGLNTENRWLVVANADGSQAQAIEALGENEDKVTVAWSPNDQVVAFSATGRPQGFDSSEIYLIGKNHENFKSLIVEGRDFRPLWSTDGERLVYSVYNSENGYRPTLWITDAEGDSIGANRRSIGLNTWADKCTFGDARTVYCAVPESLEEGIGLQPSLAGNVPDQVYRIDIETGARNLIGAPLEGASMSRLMLSEDGRYLFYTDTRTGILRQMQLR
ncbi:hypothetical protein HY478_03665 [Candidatus Uhrbacteria bacterium]|nr:hypothetical protein [Candidatus Uhrbacteria bacterium]